MKQKVSMRVAAIAVLAIFAGAMIGNHAVQAKSEPNVKSFCEYATGVTYTLNRPLEQGGTEWYQTWGAEAPAWFECESSPNVGFLGPNDVSELRGSAHPDTGGLIPGTLIYCSPFGGLVSEGRGLWLVRYSEENPGEIDGEIYADIDGVLFADLNAENAVVDEDAGTIAIALGVGVDVPEEYEEPYAAVSVVAATGCFKSLHQVGDWEAQVSGTALLQRVPGLDLQMNIFAALGNHTLIIETTEELVLSGSYYRSSPAK